jgi:hypothetical protein
MAYEHRGLPFLKRRYARAIECGDHETAARLRLELDLLMNGPLARLEADGAGNRPFGRADDDAGLAAGDAGKSSGEEVPDLLADVLRGVRRNASTPLDGTDWFVLREC